MLAVKRQEECFSFFSSTTPLGGEADLLKQRGRKREGCDRAPWIATLYLSPEKYTAVGDQEMEFSGSREKRERDVALLLLWFLPPLPVTKDWDYL